MKKWRLRRGIKQKGTWNTKTKIKSTKKQENLKYDQLDVD